MEVTMKYAIFDKNGMVAFYDHAVSEQDALKKLQSEDESYCCDPPRVHALDAEECSLMDQWLAADQATHLWPFDWRGSLR
jgi:hypothetical protein